MSSHIDDLRRRITDLERELEGEFGRARERWRYRIDAGRVRFERDARMAHRRLKQSPIRHAKRIRHPHAHYHEFVEFGDAKGYQKRLPLLRAELKANQPDRDR